MAESPQLVPAERLVPDPEGGWRGADLSDDELVGDAEIAADPSSIPVPPLRHFVREDDR